MGEQDYQKFEERYLKRFRKYYKECYNEKQRKEVKNSIFENNNLTLDQKKEFWRKVIKNGMDL